jgi:hypothetical protein
MKNHASTIASAAAAALMAAGIATFTPPAVAADVAGAPVAQTYHGIQYLNGGIGEDQETAIKARGRDYNVHMTFAEGKRSAYLAGVRLTITDAGGKAVLVNDEAGPLFYARLPAGSYHATAEINGEKQTRAFTVKNSGSVNVVFFWKSA